MDANITNLLLSIFAGIISGLAMLPIASDGIRNKLFGRKKRVTQTAKKELFEAVQGMLLSGQTISEHTYKKLSENISQKYEVPISALGDKDNNIAMVLQAINSSKILPNHLKRQISDQLQAQLDGHSNSDYVPIDEFEIKNEMVTEVIYEWRENNENQEETRSFSGLEKMVIFYIVFAVGSLVTLIAYTFESYILFPITLCISAFLICINMLTSLIGTTEPKNVEFFRRLVYKIILLIVLIVFIVVLIVFIKK